METLVVVMIVLLSLDFVVKQTLQKLKNTKASELVRLKQNLFDVEYKIKSAEAVDIIQEVECAIIR